MTTEEKIIQLTLTRDEAILLTSITSLGLRSLKNDKEEMRLSIILVNILNELCPDATISLAKKMISVATISKSYAVSELLRVK